MVHNIIGIPLRTATVYFQTISLLAAVNIEWPDFTRASFTVAQAAAGEAAEVFGCLISFTNRWTTLLLAPAGTLTVMLVGYMLLVKCRWTDGNKEWTNKGREAAAQARLTIMRSWMGILTLLYGPLCYYSFILFPLTSWSEDSTFALESTILLGSSQHRWMAAISMASWILYLIGIPVFFLMMTSGDCWSGSTWQQRKSATGTVLESYKEVYW